MLEDLAEFAADEPIFIDANIFLFHAFDDENYGEIATSFLTRVESGEINAVTSALVIDEVLFKILVQEAAAHLKKPTIWGIRKALKEKPFLEKVYKPVLKYRAYLESLALLGLEIIEVTSEHVLLAAEIGSKEGLLITDAAHVALMKERGIRHLATADSDLFQIKGLIVWRP